MVLTQILALTQIIVLIQLIALAQIIIPTQFPVLTQLIVPTQHLRKYMVCYQVMEHNLQVHIQLI